LISRLGPFCSYCERRIPTNLAVEHIQPKSLHPSLEGSWENFLLACVNCNSTKGDKPVDLAANLLPDRDNTAQAYHYTANGKVQVSTSCDAAAAAMAQATLALVGLDKNTHDFTDENSRLIATERVGQRRQAWSQANDCLEDLSAQPNNDTLRKRIASEAYQTGFFSVWMEVFRSDQDMRRRLLSWFEGTEESGCFDADTALVSPAPNPDGLLAGGKL
jgi:uncharacterized protein (TIGR02646 family)